MGWISDFQVRLDTVEISSCVRELEVSSKSPFVMTGRKSWLC